MAARIETVSALISHGSRKPTARGLADAAVRTCLARAGKKPGDVDMLINTSPHTARRRDEERPVVCHRPVARTRDRQDR
jgi:hypothetical protein